MSRITTTVLLTTTLASLTLTAQGPASAAAAGPAGNAASQNPAISKTGRFVVFDSDATNLVAGDTNAKTDVFIRDTVAKTTKRVSVSATGAQGTGASYRPSVSDDGRYVAFISAAANLVPGDTNGKPDAFRKDVVTGQIVRLSTALGGAQGNAETQQVFIDGTGTKAAFTSAASNLVAGDTHPGIDVFVRDVAAGALTRASAAVPNTEYINDLSMSASGAIVGWISTLDQPDLKACDTVWMQRTATKATTKVVRKCFDKNESAGYTDTVATNGAVAYVSEDGVDWITNALTVPPGGGRAGYYRGCDGVCSYDLAAWGTAGVQDLDEDVNGGGLIRFDATGAQTTLGIGYNPAISADGNMVAFQDGPQLKLWNVATGAVTLVSRTTG